MTNQVNPRLEKLFNYISQVDPRMVNKLAYKYGYPTPHSFEGRMGFLYTGVSEEGDEFLRSIAQVHPDRELILNADGANIEPNVIDLRPIPSENTVTKADPINMKSEALRLTVIIIIVFVVYSILSKK